ncbi:MULTISPECIES: NADAR family protein [unclassified Janthinobacterium]|uniref:NADAR family protein n=1 Tax=unclassified Janthinobacterium TaxID=2610881 RepID=UPI00190F6E5F|nr:MULTISPECIES: NADAR family protein [unclassified Janthinobacterium]
MTYQIIRTQIKIEVWQMSKTVPKEEKMDEIRFYRASEKPYGAFSNLFRRPVTFEGEDFATSEHAYQAGKARKPAVKEWLMAAPSPALLAMAAHGLYVWDVSPNWSKIKFERMKNVLMAKFTQHQDLYDLLLSTGDARLVESATVDNAVNRLWGEVNGVGKNMLGKLLMEVREELHAKQAKAEKPKKKTTRKKSEREALAA